MRYEDFLQLSKTMRRVSDSRERAYYSIERSAPCTRGIQQNGSFSWTVQLPHQCDWADYGVIFVAMAISS